MANLGTTFDPSAVSDDYELIPEGNYLAQIIDSDVATTKAGTGTYAKLVWKIDGGPANGRQLIDQITLSNPNAQAVDIGQRQLKRLLNALGLGPIQDTTQLHWRPAMIKVGVKPAEGQYRSSNTVRGYEPVQGVAATSTAASPAAAAPGRAPLPGGAQGQASQPGPAAGARPWLQHRSG